MLATTKRALDIEKIRLSSGAHTNKEDGFCIMEAVAYVAGEPWSDSPKCACPALAAFMRPWNDSLDDVNRQRLKPYIVRLVGTRDGNSERRGWMALDWLARVCAAEFMELAGLTAEAADLRSLTEIVDANSLKTAQPTLAKARDAARAADAVWAAAGAAVGDTAAVWDAVGDTAWSAAVASTATAAGAAAGAAAVASAAVWAAARAAVWAAVWAAAWDAVGDTAAVWDAVGDTAWSAARAAVATATWNAAGRKFAPIIARLQDSAFELIERMLSLPEAGKDSALPTDQTGVI